MNFCLFFFVFVSSLLTPHTRSAERSTKAHAARLSSPNVRSLTAEACPQEKLFQQTLIRPIIPDILANFPF